MIPSILRIQLHPDCPLCQFFKAVMDKPKASAADIITIDSKNLSQSASHARSGDYKSTTLLGALVITPFSDEAFRKRKFLLRLSPCNSVGRDSSPTSWKQFHASYEPGQPFPFRCVQKKSIAMDSVKMWVAGCQEMHVDHCADPGPEIMSRIKILPGFRLVDCTTRKIIEAPSSFEYVALIYVWGRPVTKDPASVSLYTQLNDSLPLEIPNTIKDAMTVTLKLGYQYLWVDKYCITQSLDVHELQSHLAEMGTIYHGAVVTIIAAAGEDANYGLPGVGIRPRIACPSITINGNTWVSGSVDTHLPLYLSKWATRGWVSV
jgi:hypothetical protein